MAYPTVSVGCEQLYLVQTYFCSSCADTITGELLSTVLTSKYGAVLISQDMSIQYSDFVVVSVLRTVAFLGSLYKCRKIMKKVVPYIVEFLLLKLRSEFDPTFYSPVFSTLLLWSCIFQSCIFKSNIVQSCISHPCNFGPSFLSPVVLCFVLFGPHFAVLHFS